MSTRRPLGLISENIRRPGTELPPATRGKILGRRDAGQSLSQIAVAEDLPKSTIRYTISNRNDRDEQQSKPRSGRPTIIDLRAERRILRLIKNSPFIEWKALLTELGTLYSKNTIKRVLHRHHISNWIAKKRPLLSIEIARKRLSWAQAHQAWTSENWRDVIFSDECSVERGKGQRRQWVFRASGTQYQKEKVIPIFTTSGLSVMVAGWFSGRLGRADLHLMSRDEDAPRGGYSARSYIRVLEDLMPQSYEPGMLFLQDNSSLHTSGLARTWLQENAISLLPIPPYSPDLNCIENLWPRLKENLCDIAPETLVRGIPINTVEDSMRERLPEAWDAIKDDVLSALVDSMPQRCQAVIEAKGWYTKY
jgi:transposase